MTARGIRTASTKREDLLKRLSDLIIGRKIESGPLKVAIDDRSAAGKSILADELGTLIRSRGFPVLRPAIDGFHYIAPRRHLPVSPRNRCLLGGSNSPRRRPRNGILEGTRARDTGVIGRADAVRRKYEVRYEPAWQIYASAEQPESKADVIIR
jgi:hypothetical protein